MPTEVRRYFNRKLLPPENFVSNDRNPRAKIVYDRFSTVPKFLRLKYRNCRSNIHEDSSGLLRERARSRGLTDFRRSARSIVSLKWDIDISVLIRRASRKIDPSNPRFGANEFAGLNYYKKKAAGVCSRTRQSRSNTGRPSRRVQLFRCVRPTKPITCSARKTKLRE